MVIICIPRNDDDIDYLAQFPSPYGDYGSYRALHQNVKEYKNVVSVPLRGLWFLSIPANKIAQAAKAFPSPYGDYGSYQLKSTLETITALGSFRPLTGIMVLINCYNKDERLGKRKRFRPLTGIMVLINYKIPAVTIQGMFMFPSPYGDYGSYQRT